jgi:hypothetical protein
MVAIMTLSVCAAVGLTTATKTEALTVTKLSFYPPTEGFSGEPMYFSGYLRDTNGHPLANKVVWLERWSVNKWAHLVSATTDSTGFYVMRYTPITGGTFHAAFHSGTTYGGSTSAGVTITVKHRLKLALTGSSKAKAGDKVVIGGVLHDAYTGKWLGNAPVKIYYHYSGTTAWTYWTSGRTLPDGSIYIVPRLTFGSHSSESFYIRYAGDNLHRSAPSNVRTVSKA